MKTLYILAHVGLTCIGGNPKGLYKQDCEPTGGKWRPTVTVSYKSCKHEPYSMLILMSEYELKNYKIVECDKT